MKLKPRSEKGLLTPDNHSLTLELARFQLAEI
jgi:hypothetical protein